MKFFSCLLFALAAFLPLSAEVFIADFLTDPGFEKPHEKHQQLNAKGSAGHNGWSAQPKDGNYWTSVNYMTEEGMAPGDRRKGIKPAEGESYMRMLTVKSSAWLALESPAFDLKNGETYSVAFQVARDNQPPMSRLEVSLYAKGNAYQTRVYDLIRMEDGWNEIVYRVKYEGPDRKGTLRLVGRREDANANGSLCFDDFRRPNTENTGFAVRPEVSGDLIPLPGTVQSDWGSPILPLDAAGNDIPLRNRAGKYRLFLHCRSSDRSGNEGDSMLGGYTYFLPFSRYRLKIGSREIPLEISRRMVKGAGREKDGTAVYTGWLYSPEIELEADAVLTLSCSKPGGFLSQLLLLDAEGWEAEKLRSGDLFTESPGKGFGDAWAGMTRLPARFYSVRELERLLTALELFKKFPALQKDGRILAEKLTAYLAQRTSMNPAFRTEGAALAAELRTYLARCDREFRETLTPALLQSEKRIDAARQKANPQNPNGREALFNLDLAEKYWKAAKEKLAALNPESEIRTGADEILFLSYYSNLSEFLGKGETASALDQTDRFPGKRLAKPAAAPARQLTTEETLNLNGVWQFGPGSFDRPPSQWVSAPIPNNGPAYFYNPKNRSNQEWADTHGVYWESANIPGGWFKTEFTVPADWNGSALALRIGELMLYGEVFVNGVFCGSHTGGFYPF